MSIAVFLEEVGRRELQALRAFGRFWLFAWRCLRWLPVSTFTRRNFSLLLPQLYEVGNRSVFVILITGLFVGLVLAVQAYAQLEAIGLQDRLGVLVNLSVVRELGPVLAGVMLAGRVGGALVAELGTMNVTEQIDALRSMGSDPIRHLVVPRLLACVLLTPVLTVFCEVMGAAGGALIAVWLYGIAAEPYWYYTAAAIETYDMMNGLLKSLLFGGIIALISCYKAFHCRAGAEGVGRACTEAFVASFIAILVIDFFMGVLLNAVYDAIWGFAPLL
jgi:phospholipid/cholesterol/gamma-HCH transport system permease protein